MAYKRFGQACEMADHYTARYASLFNDGNKPNARPGTIEAAGTLETYPAELRRADLRLSGYPQGMPILAVSFYYNGESRREVIFFDPSSAPSVLQDFGVQALGDLASMRVLVLEQYGNVVGIKKSGADNSGNLPNGVSRYASGKPPITR